jgi:hypothetical protein
MFTKITGTDETEREAYIDSLKTWVEVRLMRSLHEDSTISAHASVLACESRHAALGGGLLHDWCGKVCSRDGGRPGAAREQSCKRARRA